MNRVYYTTARPARTAKRARELWDKVESEDGAPPKWLGLFIDAGAFREWAWLRANGEMDVMDAGLVGVPHRRELRDGKWYPATKGTGTASIQRAEAARHLRADAHAACMNTPFPGE